MYAIGTRVEHSENNGTGTVTEIRYHNNLRYIKIHWTTTFGNYVAWYADDDPDLMLA